MAPQSKEILKGSPDEKITIKSFEDFKRRINISELPEGELKEFFIKPLETTQGELDELRKSYIKGEPNLSTVKDFLESSRLSIIEEAKQGAQEVKKIAGNLEESVRIENIKNKQGEIDGKNADSQIDNALESISNSTENLSGEIKDKTKSSVEKAKVVAQKVKESGYTVQLGEAMNDAFSKLKKFDIWGALVSLFKGLFGMFAGGEVLKKAGDKVKETLSSEEIQKTKAETKKYIIDKFGTTITEENKEKLSKKLDNLSQKEIENLAKEIREGNLNFISIGRIIPNIYKEFLKEEQINVIKEKAKKDLEKAIIFDIEKKYGIQLEGSKITKLQELIKENTTISDETIGELIEIERNKQITTKDLFGPIFEGFINSSSLLIGLVSNEIIPLSSIGIDFAKDGMDVLKFSASALGISKVINLENFNKTLENASETEKAVLVGLLYRKGGLFLNIIGNIGESISRLSIESLTKTEIRSFDMVSNSFTGNYEKQIQNFEKIAQKLDPTGYKGNTDILREAQKNLNKIKENYQILNIISESKGNTKIAIESLEKLNIKIPEGININSSIEELTKGFKNSRLIKIDFLSKESIHGNFGFGKTKDLYNLNSKIENILNAQNKMFEGGFIQKGFGKLKELLNIGEISRLGDRMTLHFESVDEAKKGISKLNILANKFPELLKGILDKLPIIAVAGIAANSEKPFLEELHKEMYYLFPIVGPILLIQDSGISWENGEIKGINTVEAGIAGALLTVDSFFITKEFATNGFKGGAKYMIKPISDIYSLGRGTFEGAHNISKAAMNGKSFSAIKNEAISMTKNIKKPKLRTIAILLGIGYLGVEAVFADNNLENIFGKDGKLDKKKLKEEVGNLNDEDKLVCLNYLVAKDFGESNLNNVNIEIDNNKVNIISNNKNIKSDWIISDYMIEDLQLNPEISFEYKENHA